MAGPSWRASLPPPPAHPTALQALQDALVRGEPFPGVAPDQTLEIVSAPHPLRELEVLRDRLLEALAADPTLEVHQIAVLAPDIQVYAPFLDAAFGSDDPGRNLRYHVIDLDLGRENSWLRGLDALLSLVSGTIDRPTLFTLIDTAAFQEAWELEDERDLWLDYTEVVSAWREEPGAGPAPQTWSASWDRLFEGWFRGADQLNLDVAPSNFQALGRFHQLVEDLRARGRQVRQPRSFAQWITFFDDTVAAFLAPGEGTGAVLSGRLRTLVQDAGSPEDPLPWAGFRAFVQDQIAHFPGRRGQLLTEGLHCSSLTPLRAIPFRVLAVLGLDEGRFPRQASTPSFDLRRHEPGQEALSTLSLDRYCFWETLMAAQSVLYLSYQGRSPIDGSERPPSPVLADLLDYLEEGGTPWPVSQASVKDFSVLPGSRPTASPRTWRRALALAHQTSVAPDPTLPPETVEDLFPEVRSTEVVQAFTAPARFHLRRVRQVVLRDEDRRGVDEEEPWSLDFLDRQGWLQEGLRRHLSGQEDAWDVDGFLDRMVATGQVRAGVFTERDRRDLKAQWELVSEWARDLKAEGWGPEGLPPARTRWAGRPWAPDGDDRLWRGGEILLPRFLYTDTINARTRLDASVRVLLHPAETVTLATLNPSGDRVTQTWGPDEGQTEALASRAEAYWRETARRPLGFYPDYWDQVADRRKKEPDEPWTITVEEAWWKAKNGWSVSESTLARCPYAALAFPDDPDWSSLARDAQLWWDDLFLPLSEAWR